MWWWNIKEAAVVESVRTDVLESLLGIEGPNLALVLLKTSKTTNRCPKQSATRLIIRYNSWCYYHISNIALKWGICIEKLLRGCKKERAISPISIKQLYILFSRETAKPETLIRNFPLLFPPSANRKGWPTKRGSRNVLPIKATEAINRQNCFGKSALASRNKQLSFSFWATNACPDMPGDIWKGSKMFGFCRVICFQMGFVFRTARPRTNIFRHGYRG